MNADEISELGKKASLRIVEAYSWQHIADEYESRFSLMSE